MVPMSTATVVAAVDACVCRLILIGKGAQINGGSNKALGSESPLSAALAIGEGLCASAEDKGEDFDATSVLISAASTSGQKAGRRE